MGSFLSLINEGYIFIRGSTCIRLGMVSGKLAFARFSKQQTGGVLVVYGGLIE